MSDDFGFLNGIGSRLAGGGIAGRVGSMTKTLAAILISSLASLSSLSAGEGKHLFILSGQSNMAGLKPQASFTPTVEGKFGKANVIIVFDAQGGQPIRRWFKDWKPEGGEVAAGNGDLYERMMKKVEAATKDQEITSVTFLWMQGERDAKESHGEVYEASLNGLIKQVADDLGKDHVNVVIGRLSDFGLSNKSYVEWEMVREAQVKVAKDAKSGAWVDTDDLNNKTRGEKKIDDLHYTPEGYVTFGKRLADAAIGLIEKK
jgi:NADPH:quinone reductase-like Zn-dependent oxidoreductase